MAVLLCYPIALTCGACSYKVLSEGTQRAFADLVNYCLSLLALKEQIRGPGTKGSRLST